MKKTDISVVILTYNPKWTALMRTLHSIIIQKDINCQIVISDDGSGNNLFSEAEKYLQSNNITDYILLPAEKNSGTVKNVYKGLLACTGKYVKLISPGDYLSDSHVLKNWTDCLEKSGRKWSIGGAVYYKAEGNNFRVFERPAQPVATNVYQCHSSNAVRWCYTIYQDIALGASIISELDITIKYIERILDKVIFAEDNCYRLMVFDGFIAEYYDAPAVLYEYGEGVSNSSSSIWKERLSGDWNAATKEMLENTDYEDPFKIKMRDALLNSRENRLKRFFQPARLGFSIGKHLIRKKTCISVTKEMEEIILHTEN